MAKQTSRPSGSKKKLVLFLLAAVIGVAAVVWGYPYYKRHFKTVRVDHEAVIRGEKADLGDHRILTVYFTRVGNTDFDPNVNAVSGASLLLSGDTLLGSSQVLAEMIQDGAGGDLYAIHTQKKYPSSYNGTVSEARREMNDGEQLALEGDLPEVQDYDTVFLVYPVWWGTIPEAVESFLKETDLAGKSLIPVATHGGSRFASSVKDLAACTGASVLEDQALEIYCDDVPTSREVIARWLSGLTL